jgi:intraflagellar transport protein 74
LKNQITFAVEQITLQGMNTKNIASSLKMSALNEKNDLSSQNGLLKEYNKLSIQLKQLKILEKRIQNQLSQMRQEEADLLGDIRKYRNLEVSSF